MHERTIANKIESVLVIGLGKVGSLVATLLRETGYRVTGLVKNWDSHPSGLNSSSY